MLGSNNAYLSVCELIHLEFEELMYMTYFTETERYAMIMYKQGG